MHILGKVLLWLCVIVLIPASLILSVMTLDVRNRWLTQVHDRQARLEKGLDQIAETQRRVRLLEEQRQTLVHAWGDVWNSPNSQAQPGTAGAVELGVGASSGLPQRGADGKIDPSVYIFADTQNGSQYLGEFLVTDIRPAQAVVRLARTPYPQEVESWPRGTFHLRATLPSNFLTMISDLQGHQAVADAILVDQQLQLEISKNLIKSSQVTLAQRMAELNGNPDASPGASDEVKDGLIESLRKYETVRNEQLVVVDKMRREMMAQYSLLRESLNRSLEKSRILDDRYRSEAKQSQPASVQTEEISTLKTADRDE